MKISPAGAGRREMIADLVVEFQHRQVRLRDEEIFVVAMVADQREALQDCAAGRCGGRR